MVGTYAPRFGTSRALERLVRKEIKNGHHRGEAMRSDIIFDSGMIVLY